MAAIVSRAPVRTQDLDAGRVKGGEAGAKRAPLRRPSMTVFSYRREESFPFFGVANAFVIGSANVNADVNAIVNAFTTKEGAVPFLAVVRQSHCDFGTVICVLLQTPRWTEHCASTG